MPSVHQSPAPVQPTAPDAARWAAFEADWGPGSAAGLAALDASEAADPFRDIMDNGLPDPYADLPFEDDPWAGDAVDQLDAPEPSDLDQLCHAAGLTTDFGGYCEGWAREIARDGTDAARWLSRQLRDLASQARALMAETPDEFDDRLALMAEWRDADLRAEGYDRAVAEYGSERF